MPDVEPTATDEFLVVTGMSGAGRSTVANALEDLGWFVVDNLPPQMLKPLLEMTERAGSALPKVAAVVDVRGRELFDELPVEVRSIAERRDITVVFLDAQDDVLVRRFESVRRPHPLQGSGSILDGIHTERRRLAPIREAADIVIDTSRFNVHDLARHVYEEFSEEDQAKHKVVIMSFGFKYGLPPDADQVADMRFLPNPFWNEELRNHTGLDEPVRDYVLSQEGASEFLDQYEQTLKIVLDGYQRENKTHSLFAIGCTGGKHRSVAMTEQLAERLAQLPGIAVSVRHRDLGRE